MTNDSITHPGIVRSIQGDSLLIQIVQTSLCAGSHAKGYCTSADNREKLVQVVDREMATRCTTGQEVMLVGETSMGLKAVGYAFVLPFLLMIILLFAVNIFVGSELWAAVVALGVLVPYYTVVWSFRHRLQREFRFRVETIKNN